MSVAQSQFSPEQLARASQLVARSGRVSTTTIQRELGMSWQQASNLICQLWQTGDFKRSYSE